MLISPTDTAADRLIVALDVASKSEALALVDELAEHVRFYKVGLQLFAADGMDIVRELRRRHKRVFLDLKMDDIDETIASAVRVIATQDVDLLTLQGGGATARAAVAGRGNSRLPRLLQVTLLSSQDQGDLADLRIIGDGARFPTLSEYILWRAERSMAAGCDGVIASGESIGDIRARVGDNAIIVSPGIRPGGVGGDEHKRSVTPAGAIAAGADYLVVGRPIRNASDRRGMTQRVIDEIEQGTRAPVG